MKIVRSTKCSIKEATQAKRDLLKAVLIEYGFVVNTFIKEFWLNCPKKSELLKPVVDVPSTWLSARLRKVAAREAIDMILSVKKRDEAGSMPVHHGNRMCVSSNIAGLQLAKQDGKFDFWLHLANIGNKIIFDIPIKSHKHFNRLSLKGNRLESYVITNNYVQFAFEIETGSKKEPDKCIGIDTGINALASLNNGQQFGLDIKNGIERIKRCKHGSKGQRKAVCALHQRMDEVAKEIVTNENVSLVVVENLKNITQKTKNPKRRLGKNMRRTIGRWNVRYWFNRLQQQCESNRVSFRTVSAYKTSQRCSSCGHTDRGNRSQETFLCLNCGHTDNADVNAAKNILERFLTGPYGAGCKPMNSQVWL
jgi:IS605 OrfB family transposase